MYPSPCPAGAARARGHIPGFGEITAAWLLPSSCHHLFPPRPPPAVPVTGRARRARRLCRAGLQRGAGLHCDAGRLSRHLLFSRLLERVCLQTIPPPRRVFYSRHLLRVGLRPQSPRKPPLWGRFVLAERLPCPSSLPPGQRAALPPETRLLPPSSPRRDSAKPRGQAPICLALLLLPGLEGPRERLKAPGKM